MLSNFFLAFVLVTRNWPQTSALVTTTFDNLDDSSLIPENIYPDCTTWADLGECHLYYEYMYEHCTESCVSGEDLGTIGYFLKEKEMLDYDEEDEEEVEECVNIEDYNPNTSSTCEELAYLGECHMNPRFMKEKCAKSCLYCLPAGVETFEIGVSQEILDEHRYDEEHIKNTLEIVAATSEYMSEEVMENNFYGGIRRSCYNEGEYCASMAALGFCEEKKSNEYYFYMMKNCAPACQSCEILELLDTCLPDEDENVFEEGDLDMMFRRIVGEEFLVDGTTLSNYVPVVHSRPDHPPMSVENNDDPIQGPWVVTLDNFLSEEECDHLIEIGYTNGNEEEFEEGVNNDTALNSLCKSDCYNDPVVKLINQRMSATIGIPGHNSEYLEMLKYVAGHKYQRKNFPEENQYETMPGPTVVTVYLFLNDVRKGGEVSFKGIDTSLNIQPKKGTALIWPGVQNNPSHLEWRTLFYESLPVRRGVKYGIRASFHLRSYDHDNCDYEHFHSVRWW